jgi:hypothetical protein
MTHTCLHSQSLGKIILLFLMALLCARLSATQDFQIMVSGPWSYAENPQQPDRIFLVAPPSTHHKAYILAGPDAASFGGTVANPGKPIDPGNHTLDFPDSSYPGTYTAMPPDAPVVFHASVGAKKLSTILSNTSRQNYVMSLPKPDDYSTYIDPAGKVDGYSESKVSTVDASVKPSVQPQIYTTWMVLHYGVKKLPPFLKWTGPNSPPTISTTDSAARSGAISIVLGDPDLMDNDAHCDIISLESLHERNGLWGLTEYARFPEQNGAGQQIHYLYNYHCNDSTLKSMTVDHTPMYSKSGGGADCHTAQLSINKAGPPPPTQ